MVKGNLICYTGITIFLLGLSPRMGSEVFLKLKDCIAAPESQTKEKGGVAREELETTMFQPVMVHFICAFGGSSQQQGSWRVSLCPQTNPCPRQVGLALTGIPSMGVGDESEVATLLNPVIYL